jgi:hypothetical protein
MIRLNFFRKKKKEKPNIKEKVDLLLNNWIIESLEIQKDDIKHNHVDRVYIKDGQWFFNDYFDGIINRDAMKHSQKLLRRADEHEIKIFNSFKNLQLVFN